MNNDQLDERMIRKRRSRFRSFAPVAAIALLAISAPAMAADAGEAAGRIASLLTKLPHGQTRCGAMIVDLGSGETIYSRNTTDPLVPASNQKLVVISTALETLGAHDWAFRTRLAVRGNDLIIIGDGDPGLGDQKIAERNDESPTNTLDRWALALKEAGHGSIAGNLVVDASVFDEQFVHPDWEPGDLVKWYGAPVGGLNFNDNCVEVTAWPGDKDGDPAVWDMYPRCPLAEVVNKCKSSLSGNKTPVVGRRQDSFKIVLSGLVSKRSTLQSISVPQPNAFAATAIAEYLAGKGISIAGAVRFDTVRDPRGELPGDCRLIAEQSTDLADVLARIGQDSQNMFAEAMLKRLGYEWAVAHHLANPVGSWDTGRHAVMETLRRAGCDLNRLVIADGSGLSRNNRVTADDMIKLLAYMHTRPEAECFRASLAGNRTGGTLDGRFDATDGDIYAKTGYMRGIRTLSGYVHTPDDRWYAVSILFNGFPGSSTPYRRLQEQVCRILAEQS